MDGAGVEVTDGPTDLRAAGFGVFIALVADLLTAGFVPGPPETTVWRSASSSPGSNGTGSDTGTLPACCNIHILVGLGNVLHVIKQPYTCASVLTNEETSATVANQKT